MRKIVLILIMAMVITTTICAQARRGVPAAPYPIEHIQPNGDTLMIRLHGDEHRHWRTTLDGYLIKQNSQGKMCYAKYNRKGEIRATCRTAHNAENRRRCEEKYVTRHIPNTYPKKDI